MRKGVNKKLNLRIGHVCFNSFKNVIEYNGLSTVDVTETWLSATHSPVDFCTPSFNLVQVDRNGVNTIGVALYLMLEKIAYINKQLISNAKSNRMWPFLNKLAVNRKTSHQLPQNLYNLVQINEHLINKLSGVNASGNPGFCGIPRNSVFSFNLIEEWEILREMNTIKSDASGIVPVKRASLDLRLNVIAHPLSMICD
ncbi:hypothetical protein WA026_016624 [Henosepilachna vigintioctopunctata]|uniref:Uncharacterized protein n=1 Tax=Henosepilachna vigintioctopunctata TaxID=420089 RepID=A0AAW1VGP3_9CUCU